MAVDTCNKPTANGLPCALGIGHDGDCKRAAQIITGGGYTSTPEEMQIIKERNTVVHNNDLQKHPTYTKKKRG